MSEIPLHATYAVRADADAIAARAEALAAEQASVGSPAHRGSRRPRARRGRRSRRGDRAARRRPPRRPARARADRRRGPRPAPERPGSATARCKATPSLRRRRAPRAAAEAFASSAIRHRRLAARVRRPGASPSPAPRPASRPSRSRRWRRRRRLRAAASIAAGRRPRIADQASVLFTDRVHAVARDRRRRQPRKGPAVYALRAEFSGSLDAMRAQARVARDAGAGALVDRADDRGRRAPCPSSLYPMSRSLSPAICPSCQPLSIPLRIRPSKRCR